MKQIYSLLIFVAAVWIATGAFAQDDDWYRPGGFDADGGSLKTFSVSDTKAVKFSRGNLQYNAAQDKWRFAPRQYTMQCSNNDNASEDYDGWIDLFGYGTSGWESGAENYQPWNNGVETGYHGFIDDYTEDGIVGDNAYADWGVYNKISNGGNREMQWRTLTHNEWVYLLGNSAKRNGKYGLATLNGFFKGMVILPDEWTLPNGLTFTSGYANEYATNRYTMNEWHRMEAAGAVFLPAAGERWGETGNAFNYDGCYWSSTPGETFGGWNSATYLYFMLDTVGMWGAAGYQANSVRLVRDNRPDMGSFSYDGASKKTFSVSSSKRVSFSRGNLQYNAAENKWRFATQQFAFVGDSNANISSSYNGWIDLFGWGTSGWNSGATAYQPWSTRETDQWYQPGNSGYNNLSGEYANADWGVYNRISNGGNKAGQWRTLTKDEWEYLIGDNAQRSGKYGLATINGASKSYTGLVLLPDDWTLPSGVTFTAGYANSFTTNTYTMVQWKKMEAAGAIFLPAAGLRGDTDVTFVGTYGEYWSSTYYNESQAWEAIFFDNLSGIVSVNMDVYYRGEGLSVRLVKD